MPTQLSVNINKVATIRNARGGNNPDVLQVALDCERFGAQGITVHPRPDQRHIRYQDVRVLQPRLTTEFNIEGNPISEFIALVLENRPTQVTLVPDAPDVLTSSAGWNVAQNLEMLTNVVDRLKDSGIRTSIFIDPDPDIVRMAARTGADRVELFTGPYARAFAAGHPQQAVAPYIDAARTARGVGLGLNAGHDLSRQNLRFFAQNVPHLLEVSIGHEIVADALYLGLQATIAAFKDCLKA